MAGLEPARANYSPTDFKSVASTIPPHRLCGVHSKLFPIPAKMDFAVKTDFDPASKRACLRFRDLLKERQLAKLLLGAPKNESTSPHGAKAQITEEESSR
jgi:hypothetical protein